MADSVWRGGWSGDLLNFSSAWLMWYGWADSPTNPVWINQKVWVSVKSNMVCFWLTQIELAKLWWLSEAERNITSIFSIIFRSCLNGPGGELRCPALATWCPHEANYTGLGSFSNGICCKTLGKEMGLVFYLSLGVGQYKIGSNIIRHLLEKSSHGINWHEYEVYTYLYQLQRRLYPKALLAVIHRA